MGLVPAVEGGLSAVGMRFAIVTTRWNTVITDRLLQGSLDCLKRSGAARADVEVVRVPGAWEIPNAAQGRWRSRDGFDAIVTLGCLLRGETAHYEAIYNEVARGIGQSQQETGDSPCVWSADLRDARASTRPRWIEGWEQGIRSCQCSH